METREAFILAALRICRRQFAFYAEQHRAKLSGALSPAKIEDTFQKARVNEELVDMIDVVLSGEIPDVVREEIRNDTAISV